MNPELAVEPCQKDFQCINLSVIEILVDSEEVLEVGDVLREASRLAECFRAGSACIRIRKSVFFVVYGTTLGSIRPLLGFKGILFFLLAF